MNQTKLKVREMLTGLITTRTGTSQQDALEAQTDAILQLVKEAVRSEYKKVNRFEVIDHTKTGEGREYVKWVKDPLKIEMLFQDDGRTLKIRLSELGEK